MPVADTPQTSIYETTIDNDVVEAALEQREAHRQKKSEANALFKEADDRVKAAIANLDLGQDAPVRIGRFVITRTMTKAKSVSFETDAKVRYRIGTIGEDD